MQRVLVLCTLLAAVALAVPVPRIPEEDIKDDPWSGIEGCEDYDDAARALLEAGEPSLIPGEVPPYHAFDPVKPSKPVINFLWDYDDRDIDDYEPWRGPDFNPDDFPIYSSLQFPEEPSLIPGEVPPYHQNPQTQPRIRGDQALTVDEVIDILENGHADANGYPLEDDDVDGDDEEFGLFEDD